MAIITSSRKPLIRSRSARKRYHWIKSTVHTTGARLAIPANTATKIPITAGLERVRGFVKWDKATSQITPDFEDQVFSVRFACCIDKIDGGGAVIEYWITPDAGVSKFADDSRFYNKGVEQCITFNHDVFVGPNFIANNAEIYIRSDKALELWDQSVFISE